MNNFKFDYGKKYHYMLKYIVMAIPVLLLVLSFLFPIKQVNNNYSVESETQINYKYLTNEVNSTDDLVFGNIYKYDKSTNISIFCDYVGFSYYSNDSLVSFDFVSNDSYYLSLSYSGTSLDVAYYSTSSSLASNGFIFSNISNIVFVYKAGTYVSSIVKCPQELIPIESTTINNTINDNSSVISVDEVKVNNTAYLKPLNDFYKLNINSWYDNLLNQMNLDLDNETTYFIYHIPLYIIYLYIFDIILDLFGMVFRLGHKLISKVGGDY